MRRSRQRASQADSVGASTGATGTAMLDGQNIVNLPTSRLNRIRAEKIAMIFQDPMTSLNPYMRVSDQMAEVLTLHKGLSKREAARPSQNSRLK